MTCAKLVRGSVEVVLLQGHDAASRKWRRPRSIRACGRGAAPAAAARWAFRSRRHARSAARRPQPFSPLGRLETGTSSLTVLLGFGRDCFAMQLLSSSGAQTVTNRAEKGQGGEPNAGSERQTRSTDLIIQATFTKSVVELSSRYAVLLGERLERLTPRGRRIIGQFTKFKTKSSSPRSARRTVRSSPEG